MIRGIRGATTVNENEKTEILHNTKELLETIISSNNVQPENVSSVLISTTKDVTATFPAQVLRGIEGYQFVPVMCFSEIDVPGGLERCIRVMMHVETPVSQADVKHIYLHEAKKLRPDLNK